MLALVAEDPQVVDYARLAPLGDLLQRGAAGKRGLVARQRVGTAAAGDERLQQVALGVVDGHRDPLDEGVPPPQRGVHEGQLVSQRSALGEPAEGVLVVEHPFVPCGGVCHDGRLA